MKSSKFWLAVLGAIIILSSAAALALTQKPATLACVYSDGILVEKLYLTGVVEPFTLTVETGDGFNIIAFERGRVRISEADCPDGSCVRQGWSSGGVRPIVCLPHRLVITFEGGGGLDLDAIAG